MASSVVLDHSVLRALKRLGAHHDVAASRGQPVQQQHRQAVARLLAGQRHAPAFNTEFGRHERHSKLRDTWTSPKQHSQLPFSSAPRRSRSSSTSGPNGAVPASSWARCWSERSPRATARSSS